MMQGIAKKKTLKGTVFSLSTNTSLYMKNRKDRATCKRRIKASGIESVLNELSIKG